jgi:hypothetical protein
MVDGAPTSRDPTHLVDGDAPATGWLPTRLDPAPPLVCPTRTRRVACVRSESECATSGTRPTTTVCSTTSTASLPPRPSARSRFARSPRAASCACSSTRPSTRSPRMRATWWTRSSSSSSATARDARRPCRTCARASPPGPPRARAPGEVGERRARPTRVHAFVCSTRSCAWPVRRLLRSRRASHRKSACSRPCARSPRSIRFLRRCCPSSRRSPTETTRPARGSTCSCGYSPRRWRPCCCTRSNGTSCASERSRPSPGDARRPRCGSSPMRCAPASIARRPSSNSRAAPVFRTEWSWWWRPLTRRPLQGTLLPPLR